MILCKICLMDRGNHTRYNGYCEVYTGDDRYTPMTNLEFLEYKLQQKEKM